MPKRAAARRAPHVGKPRAQPRRSGVSGMLFFLLNPEPYTLNPRSSAPPRPFLAALPLIRPDQFPLVEDVARYSRDQRLGVQPALHLQRLVQGVDPEVVVVRAVAGRRRGAPVAGLPERVLSLHRARRRLQFRLRRDALDQPGGVGGDLVDHPVDERLGPGRIGVFHDQRQLLGPFRHARPTQARGDVLAVAGVLPQDRLAGFERLAGYSNAHATTPAPRSPRGAKPIERSTPARGNVKKPRNQTP